MYNHLVIENDSFLLSDHDGKPETLDDIICRVLEIEPNDLSSDVPLTAYGLDSLSAASLSYALRPLLTISQLQLLADITVGQIKARLAIDEERTDEPERHDLVLTTIVTRHAADFPTHHPAVGNLAPDVAGDVYFVTGTTGSLGSNALAKLLQIEGVTRVYALNRPSKISTSIVRQRASFTKRGLDDSLLSSDRLVMLEGELDAPTFGLSSEMYEEMRMLVTHILHIGEWCNHHFSEYMEPLTRYSDRLDDDPCRANRLL